MGKKETNQTQGEEQLSFVDATLKYIKDLARPRTISEIIAKEIKEAHLRKLEAESATEYARSLAVYNEHRIARLQKRLLEHAEDGENT